MKQHPKYRQYLVVAMSVLYAVLMHISSAQAQRPSITINNIPFTKVLFFPFPNLTWADRDSYTFDGPATTRIRVDGLGIDDDVDIITNNVPFTIAEDFANRSGAPVLSGYQYSLRIVKMVFQTVSGVAGWIPGDESTHTVYFSEQSGPALRPGASTTAQFGPINPTMDFVNVNGLECGMYQVQLEVDSNNTVNEGRLYENDNDTRHHFFVQSDQIFNIDITRITSFFARRPAPVRSANFTIRRPFGSSASRVFYQALTHSGDGIVTTAPTPPLALVPGSVIRMTHIPASGETIRSLTGKITVISEDGCIIKQESHTVLPQPSLPFLQ